MNSSRHTLQREIVLRALTETPGHATADMIYADIHQSHPTISRATVYRNLRVLEEQGKLTRIEVPDGADYYESRKREHYHIQCTCCGRLFDSALPYMPALLDMARQADGDFAITACSLLFEGVCPECRAASGAPSEVNVKTPIL